MTQFSLLCTFYHGISDAANFFLKFGRYVRDSLLRVLILGRLWIAYSVKRVLCHLNVTALALVGNTHFAIGTKVSLPGT